MYKAINLGYPELNLDRNLLFWGISLVSIKQRERLFEAVEDGSEVGDRDSSHILASRRTSTQIGGIG